MLRISLPLANSSFDNVYNSVASGFNNAYNVTSVLGSAYKETSGFNSIYNSTADKLGKANELVSSLQKEGLVNTLKQAYQGATKENISMGTTKVEKKLIKKPALAEKKVTVAVPFDNNNLDLNREVTGDADYEIESFSKSMSNRPMGVRNRGQRGDVKGSSIAYTYAPFKNYQEHQGNQYATIKIDKNSDNQPVIAYRGDKLTSGTMGEFKGTTTLVSPTFKTNGVRSLSPGTVMDNNIRQNKLNLNLDNGSTKPIPIGVGDQNGQYRSMSGGHLMVENPKTKEIVVLHGTSNHLAVMFAKFLKENNLDSANILETDHGLYSLNKKFRNGVLTDAFNTSRDNDNTNQSGSGNFIYEVLPSLTQVASNTTPMTNKTNVLPGFKNGGKLIPKFQIGVSNFLQKPSYSLIAAGVTNPYSRNVLGDLSKFPVNNFSTVRPAYKPPIYTLQSNNSGVRNNNFQVNNVLNSTALAIKDAANLSNVYPKKLFKTGQFYGPDNTPVGPDNTSVGSQPNNSGLQKPNYSLIAPTLPNPFSERTALDDLLFPVNNFSNVYPKKLFKTGKFYGGDNTPVDDGKTEGEPSNWKHNVGDAIYASGINAGHVAGLGFLLKNRKPVGKLETAMVRPGAVNVPTVLAERALFTTDQKRLIANKNRYVNTTSDAQAGMIGSLISNSNASAQQAQISGLEANNRLTEQDRVNTGMNARQSALVDQQNLNIAASDTNNAALIRQRNDAVLAKQELINNRQKSLGDIFTNIAEQGSFRKANKGTFVLNALALKEANRGENLKLERDRHIKNNILNNLPDSEESRQATQDYKDFLEKDKDSDPVKDYNRLMRPRLFG